MTLFLVCVPCVQCIQSLTDVLVCWRWQAFLMDSGADLSRSLLLAGMSMAGRTLLPGHESFLWRAWVRVPRASCASWGVKCREDVINPLI